MHRFPILRVLLVALGASFLSGSLPVQEPLTPIRIACVGDSITEGTANADYRRNSWPQILERLIESESPGAYEVGNFGRSGATLLKSGRKPYWSEAVFAKGLAFAPDVVVINLGTNDATPVSWDVAGDAFEADYRALIETYQALDSQPRILLSNLTPIVAPHPNVEACAPNRVAIEAVIAKLAAEYGLAVIDLYTPLEGRDELLPDGLHPNTAGNERLAQAVFTALFGKPSPSDASIRPVPVPGEALQLVRGGELGPVVLGSWSRGEDHVEGTGPGELLLAGVELGAGDFHLGARLRLLDQERSASGFVLGSNFFGFEGAAGTVFRNGPQVGGLRLLHRSETLWERDAWIDFEVIRIGELVWFLVDGFVVDMALIPGPIERLGFDPHRSRMQVADWSLVGPVDVVRAPQLKERTVATPWLDLAARLAPKRVAESEADRPRTPGETLTVRSPDGAQLVEILGAEATAALGLEGPNSMACAFAAEGATPSEPFELAASLSGAGHVAHYLPDGRLLLVLRDTFPTSPTFGDVVAWVGTYADVVQQREGEFTCRLIAKGAGELDVLSLAVADEGGIRVRARCRAEGKLPEVVELRFELADMTELLPTRGFDVPQLDLDAATERQVVVDREEGQYLGHVTTVLLEDGETLLAVYPKGHGRGQILYKRSTDGGRTWSERLPTPASWATSQEVPTIHRVIDPVTGAKRLILWSGLYPARLAHSADDGASWSELQPVGEWGGIVVMGFVERLASGAYLAMFHDDGRFFTGTSAHQSPPVFRLYKTFSHDGGLTWETPEVVWSGSESNLCEPGCVRSPDGKTLAVLLRENRRVRNSFVIFSADEGQTWSAPRELPASLTGDRHTGKYAPDGRLVLSFRDTALESPTQGDWVAWVGTFEDLLFGLPGQYRARLKDNLHAWDTAYPGVEVLPNGTFVATTYGHWEADAEPYIMSVRFTLAELDAELGAPGE